MNLLERDFRVHEVLDKWTFVPRGRVMVRRMPNEAKVLETTHDLFNGGTGAGCGL